MIEKSSSTKMLQKLLILPLLFLSIHASGEFSILSSPDSLAFKGSEKLDSDTVGDVIAASIGLSVDNTHPWSGLIMNDPFNVAKSAVAVLVDGVEHLSLTEKSKTYQLVGNSAADSLNILNSDLESANLPVVDFDFSEANGAELSNSDFFGAIPALKVKATNNLKPELHSEDKHLLKQLAYIDALAEKLPTLQKRPSLLTVRVSLLPIASAHGEKSAAVLEASKLLADAISRLSQSANQSAIATPLFVVVANKDDLSRSKRQAADDNNAKELNLAEYYSENYPVIFNIILWFMVIFFFALLAICYAIASMDPGRDSIIYRMTSTRMKKDN